MKTLLTLAAAALASAAAPAAPMCEARSTATPPTVVELYTSEGCSSCPPADRWLSTLKGRTDVLPLAFHVGYWDRLGWVDRFASPGFTERQYEQARIDRKLSVYTPQVVVQGRDWPSWPKLPKADGTAAVAVQLSRDGESVTAQVSGVPSGQRLTGYWAVLEDGHQSKVRAGENAGETLKHDHVVRLLRPVPEWAGPAGARWQLTVSSGAAEYPRRVVFVVTDATTHRPVQAVSLAC